MIASAYFLGNYKISAYFLGIFHSDNLWFKRPSSDKPCNAPWFAKNHNHTVNHTPNHA